MYRLRLAASTFKLAFGTAMVAACCVCAIAVQAQDATTTSERNSENSSASLESHHHYNSPAERANDALLETEVKSALANGGVAEDSPIVVDADHGKILLIGVLKSPEDAKRAGQIAASTPGVRAVENRLTWH
jgi:osmotically-inducible protein OsmY